jgi:hypothetical protein
MTSTLCTPVDGREPYSSDATGGQCSAVQNLRLCSDGDWEVRTWIWICPSPCWRGFCSAPRASLGSLDGISADESVSEFGRRAAFRQASSFFPLRSLGSSFRHRPARMPSQSSLQHSQPLSLTESHLSAEAVFASPPAAASALSTSRPRQDHALSSHSHTSERTVQNEKATVGGSSSGKGTSDLDGGVLPAVGTKPPLSADGSEVLVVDWKGEDDPLFPKNWSNRTRMGATFMSVQWTSEGRNWGEDADSLARDFV